jgi:type III secretion protein U
MSGQGDEGDKTEEPSAKKLRDARERGEVAKSRDLTSTAGLLAVLVLLELAAPWAGVQLKEAMAAMLAAVNQPFDSAAAVLGGQALRVLLVVSAAVLLPVGLLGVLVEFLQAGPVFTTEKLALKFEALNPAEGIGRMFSIDSLIEVAKSMLKTCVLLWVGSSIAWELVGPLMPFVWSVRVDGAAFAIWDASRNVLSWAVGVFAMLSVLDFLYQRWSFLKKMRMSPHDVKQEAKEQEGDPRIKARRKQMGDEWLRNAANAARRANVLIVNPTHVAIAIDYDRETCPVPSVSAKGQDDVARAMRAAAEKAGVPIVRNVPLAWDLLERCDIGEPIPAAMFDVIAEVILWAREVRDEMAGDGAGLADSAAKRARSVPGEDLTRRGGVG